MYVSIYHDPGNVPLAGDTMINKLEIVHVFMEFIAQQERSKPLSYQTCDGFKVPTSKPGLPDLECSLIGKTSCSFLPLPGSYFHPQVPTGIYMFCSTRPSLIAGLGLF